MVFRMDFSSPRWFPMILLTALAGLLFSTAAGTLRHRPASLPVICGTPEVSQKSGEAFLNELSETDPILYRQYLEEIQKVNRFNKAAKTARTFWAYNFKDKKYYTVSATLRKTGNLSQIWVEDDSWNRGYVNQTIVDSVYFRLEKSTNSHSIDPNTGIIELDTTLFGQPPNYDGDGIIDFLILDIRDSFDSTQTGSPFVAGYFSPEDQTDSPVSNKMDLMYLDSYPGIYYQGRQRPDRVMATTAHEFQHLIHYHYDRTEATWVNEGLSELASTYCGYGLDFPGLFLQNTNQNLTGWDGQVKDYARVQLWTVYCAEQLNLPFIHELVRRPEHGIDGFNAALQASGINGIRFPDVFRNWVLANRVNNTLINPAYGYRLPEAAGLRAAVNRLVYTYPQSVSGEIEPYAGIYHRFRGQDSLIVSFQQQAPENYVIVSGGASARVTTLSQTVWQEPSFTEDSSYVLVQVAQSVSASYAYQAMALYSLDYFELAYDDGQPDISLLFGGVAANKFSVPHQNISLEQVKFWNASANNSVRIHVYGTSQGGLPGNDLTTPIDTVIGPDNNWALIDLASPLAGLSAGETIFVGVEETNGQNSIGYDDVNNPGVSYLRQGSWTPLANYQINGNPANGVWLIRAVFSGLVPSDSLASPPAEQFTIAGAGNFPNPFSAGTGTFVNVILPDPGSLDIAIFNILGQRVAAAAAYPALMGENRINLLRATRFDANQGAGIYLFRIIFHNQRTGKEQSSGFYKMVFLK